MVAWILPFPITKMNSLSLNPFLVNHSRRFRRFWEYYLCFVVRGKVIEWRLEVVKNDRGAARPAAGRPPA